MCTATRPCAKPNILAGVVAALREIAARSQTSVQDAERFAQTKRWSTLHALRSRDTTHFVYERLSPNLGTTLWTGRGEPVQVWWEVWE
jgi:hypothetical protein